MATMAIKTLMLTRSKGRDPDNGIWLIPTFGP